MRQIIELVSTLINKNPDRATAKEVKSQILERNLLIITHRGAQPLVKPAFKSSESLLAKGTVSPTDIINSYASLQTLGDQAAENLNSSLEDLWTDFISICFRWMSFPDISPGSGKFLVTVFRDLRLHDQAGDNRVSYSWQNWIQQGLNRDPEILENVKNYLFPPLFKLDRDGSLRFLQELNGANLNSSSDAAGLDAQALLYLAAIDAGKKSGLVQDASESSSGTFYAA